MNRRAPCLSVLLLPEDSGDDAFATFLNLMKELLKQVDPSVQTQPDKLAFEPVRNQQALRALQANIWKSEKQKDHGKQVELVRTLATQLMLENGWAFFHFDGDRAWANRDSSENESKFKTRVRERVQRLIQEELEKRERQAGKVPAAKDIEARAARRTSRLKQVVPFYSIEAWLFQNTRVAIRLCQKHYSGRDVPLFQKWEREREALDEVLKPKEAVCLGSKHNRELASDSFPAREARAAGKSFDAAIQVLSQDAELCEALCRTYTSE